MKKTLFTLAILTVCLLIVPWALAEDALPDGDYAPDDFTFSGGSGRVEITCPQVTLAGGAATASITFSSPHYTTLTLDGVSYEGEQSESATVFRIPAPLNRAFEIAAVTTAMSRPHEIAYTLYIRLDAAGGADLPGLSYQSSLALDYAECFSVDYYEGGYALIDVKDSARYLVVPEGMALPEGLDPDITPLYQPLDRAYVANSAAMALIDRIGALDSVRFSGLQAEDWRVENAAEAMAEGRILYAGKYSEPDYELLLRESCDVALENTMLLHTPKVQELLTLLGVPVFIDRSSYEPHPLGRTEWIKLYGVLFDREEEAAAFFSERKAAVEALAENPSTGKTVAYFYITSDGSAVVRSAEDYIARMIELGGGVYAFRDLDEPGSGHASVTITMEEFYATAVNADYLIYTNSIDKTVRSLDDLMARSDLLADFAAVREGRVYAAGEDLYQATDRVTELIGDIHAMLGGQQEGMTFLRKLN